MSKQLFEAAEQGDIDALKKALIRKPDLNYLGSIDEYPGIKYTPLAIALYKQHWEIAGVLIARGAEIMMPGKVINDDIHYPISMALKNNLPIDLTKEILSVIPNLNQFIIKKYPLTECATTLGALIISGLPVRYRRTLLETLYPCEVLLRGPLNVFEIYEKKNCQPYLTASMFENYIKDRTITDDHLMNIELGLQCLVELNYVDKDEAHKIKQAAELRCHYKIPQNLQQQLNNIQQRQDQIEKKLDKIINALGEKQSKPSFTMY